MTVAAPRPKEWCHICGECVVCGNGAIEVAKERDRYRKALETIGGEWKRLDGGDDDSELAARIAIADEALK